MNRVMMIAVCIAAIGAVTMGAPDTAEAKRGTVGFGAGLDLKLGGIGLGNIVVPIVVSDLITIEPEFGFLSTSESNGEADTEASSLNLRFGLGALFKNSITKKTNIYGGLRFLVQINNTSATANDIDSESSQTNFAIGGVTGGEYFIDNAFSLGAEWGIFATIVGEPELTVDGDTADSQDISNTVISTSTQIFFSWYFM
jgi:hypothetical protein